MRRNISRDSPRGTSPSPVSVTRNGSTCSPLPCDGCKPADNLDGGPLTAVAARNCLFGRSPAALILSSAPCTDAPVDHVGTMIGLRRSMRRRMSAKRSLGMAPSAIWRMTKRPSPPLPIVAPFDGIGLRAGARRKPVVLRAVPSHDQLTGRYPYGKSPLRRHTADQGKRR